MILICDFIPSHTDHLKGKKNRKRNASLTIALVTKPI